MTSPDCKSYLLNSDEFFFQTSDDGRLVVTALRNRVRPVLRIKALDKVRLLERDNVEFTEITALP